MPFSGVSKVTKAGSVRGIAPCQATSLLRMLPGLLLHTPRVGPVASGARAISIRPIAEGDPGKEAAETGGKDNPMGEKRVLDGVAQRRQFGAQFGNLLHDAAPPMKKARLTVRASGCRRLPAGGGGGGPRGAGPRWQGGRARLPAGGYCV